MKSTAETMSVDEVAQLLGISRIAVNALAARGVIPCRQLGRRRIFVRSYVEESREAVALALLVEPERTPLLDDVRAAMKRLALCPTPPVGWLYALRCESVKLTKIGKAVDPVARIAELERMNAAPLILVGLAHGMRAETELHRRHSARRAHGEWFAIDVNPLPFDGRCVVCRGAVPWP